jgi:hypothetical protein
LTFKSHPEKVIPMHLKPFFEAALALNQFEGPVTDEEMQMLDDFQLIFGDAVCKHLRRHEDDRFIVDELDWYLNPLPQDWAVKRCAVWREGVALLEGDQDPTKVSMIIRGISSPRPVYPEPSPGAPVPSRTAEEWIARLEAAESNPAPSDHRHPVSAPRPTARQS